MKKRHEIPSYLELPYRFDLDKIKRALDHAPEKFEDLSDPEGYGKVADSCPCLQGTFGLKFSTIEAAYEYLRKCGQKTDEMNWDYRKFIKDDKGEISLNFNPYKQLALTEFDSELDMTQFKVKIPSTRLDERQYCKLRPWVKGTYLEDVISTFKGFVTRVRVARMEPGCLIDDHIDYNTNYSIRVHIPITSNEECGFSLHRGKDFEKELFKFPADGRVWFINQGFKHSAWNKGAEPRDHLVLSIASHDDIVDLF